jgi:hypothetical protein
MTDEQIKDATNKIKSLADVKTQSMEDVDVILRVYHQHASAGDLKIGESQKLDKLLEAHRFVAPLWSPFFFLSAADLPFHPLPFRLLVTL